MTPVIRLARRLCATASSMLLALLALTATPALNQFGTATITVTVNDGQALNNTTVRTFTVTVAVNQAACHRSGGSDGLGPFA